MSQKDIMLQPSLRQTDKSNQSDKQFELSILPGNSFEQCTQQWSTEWYNMNQQRRVMKQWNRQGNKSQKRKQLESSLWRNTNQPHTMRQ
jgi:hypothetical protein